MLHADGDAGQGVHASSELFSDGHRAVLSTGAADGDRRVSLVLLTVPREHGTQRGQICRDECIRIGLTEDGHFADADDRVIGSLFKLYPWEDLMRDEFAAAIPGAGCRFVEPAWKAVLSNKGLLPILWRMFEGHENLLPAFFEDELAVSSPRLERARAALEAGHVLKPVFGREGASVTIVEGGRETDRSVSRRL